MADWSRELDKALTSGDPEFMKAMLARVPKDVLERALPYLLPLAQSSVKEGRLEDSLTYYGYLIEAVPGYADWRAERAHALLKLGRHAEALADAERIVELASGSAVGYRLQAEACEGLRDHSRALAAYHQALRLEPGDEAIKQRIAALDAQTRKEAVLRQALDPNAPQEALRIELPPPPKVSFDPALLDDPSMPPSFEAFRVDGLKQHLWRYSGQVSPKNAITRLEDPAWRAAWDAALATTAGAKLRFQGSELGVFALRALHHGAAHALCVEAFPLDARIATGMAQKHFLTPWHAQYAAQIPDWNEEQRSTSFEEFASSIDIVSGSSDAACDCLVFPQIDHTLLGTGIARAVRQYCADGRAVPARVLPAKATVFAMGVQWAYPGADFRQEPLTRLRWAMYPQALDLGPEFWTALTEPVRAGEIDFANFSEATWDIALPVTKQGTVDAIVFWFDLDLGSARISNEPGGELQCIKPAVQYTDGIEVQAGGTFQLRARVEESRLYFQTQPAAAIERTHGLPSWYVPMLGDRQRNEAYRDAIGRALAANAADIVLDIGAGSGLLSMMAAQGGARHVVGCESNPAIVDVGNEIVKLNGLDAAVSLLGKDCRHMKVPEDLPRRADLAVFELFDCSLIGEGILHFLAHAREHLLTENAHYLPVAAKIRAMVVEYRHERILDIDASLLNPYSTSPSFINVDGKKLTYRALTEPFDVFSFDFATAGPEPEEKELSPQQIVPGTAGAVLFWFDLQLDATTWLSNDPRRENSLHWKQGLQVLPEVRLDAGVDLPIVARHNGSSLIFQWKQGALPVEALSRVPRCDPRWLAASAELEQQTRGLLQHCAQNPDEYVKVAEIAKRFAIDPAAHGLDPAIAQRFASMLLND